MTKKEILKEIIDQEAGYIEKLKVTLGEYREASDLDEQETIDRHEMSQANEAKDMQMRMRIQLDKAKADFDELQKLGEKDYDRVEAGALVTTDKAYFFVGVSIHNLEIKKKDLYGVSRESPAFKEIVGKVKGDEFTLGQNKYKIEKIA